MKAPLTQQDMMQLLDKLYEQSIDGLAKVSPPINVLATDYLQKHKDTESAAKSFIRYQIAKCTTTGFVSNLGGFITLPFAVPANIGTVLYVQMRMIACLAYMGGYDTDSDQVQTLIYACLAGISIDQILKKAGVEIGNKLAGVMVRKIPTAALNKINKKVGFSLISKSSTKSVIKLANAAPVVGGFIGGGFDFAETKIIADRAYKMFIQGNLDVLSGEEDDESPEIIEVDEFAEV